MKQKNVKKHFWLLGLLILFCMLVYSCLHDDWGTDTLSKDGVVLGSNRKLTASEAERWYNANNPPIATVRAMDPTGGIQSKPKWSGAIESRKGKFEVVEIPLLVNGSVVFMDDETKKKTDQEENLDEIRNLVRMVVIKNLETSEVCSFIMAFVGTYDYLIKKNTLLKNSYLHREPDFEGSVYFYKSGQRLVNGWRYKAGKIVARISPGTEVGYQIFTRSAKTRMMSCSEEVNWINENRCWGEPYWDQEFGMGVASICEKHSRPDYHTICVEEDGNGREPGAWDEGGGGGYDPPAVNPIKGEHYQAAIDDKFVIGKLPSSMPKQFPNTCVTSIMEYVNHCFGGDLNEGKYWVDYLEKYNLWIPEKGVSSANIIEFVNRHFDTLPFSSYKESIDRGNVVITDIPSQIEGSSHNIAVIGYHSSGDLIYMDPETGTLQEADPSFMSEHYIISISGNK